MQLAGCAATQAEGLALLSATPPMCCWLTSACPTGRALP
jgi:hypothetical protein